MIFHAALLSIASPCLFAIAASADPPPRFVNYNSLPDETVFPGPWEQYIKAPANKSYITPARIWKARGNVSDSGFEAALRSGGEHQPGSSILIGSGGTLTLEFDENISGRVCFDVESVGDEPTVNLGFSESPLFAGPVPDATTDRQERDLPLAFDFGSRTGHLCVEPEFNRGGFKYLTIQLPYVPPWHQGGISRLRNALDLVVAAGQKVIGLEPATAAVARRPFVALRGLWVNCTAFPSQANGRAYTGYFSSSSPLLNRIWYAGAYTLQLSTIDPREGSALIDYNRVVDGNGSPTGSWYNNFTISNGSAVTTDGAKRDRVVWPGDMYVAVPGIAVSTHDMAAVRAALDTLFDHQYGDGSLPYAGPPFGTRREFSDTYHLHTLLGVYNYVVYSGDVEWLKARWPAYVRALAVSAAKVDELGLLHVSSTADWLRPGMTGHNLEASAILYEVLTRSAQLASFLEEDEDDGEEDGEGALAMRKLRSARKEWAALQRTLETGLPRLYCADTGLFADNVGRRGCAGAERVDPQDGNSWALISGIVPHLLPNTSTTDSIGGTGDTGALTSPANVSEALRRRWTRYGAPAVEFPNVISPFASSFELLGHCAAGRADSAVELMLLEWAHLLDGPGFTNSTLAEGFRTDGYVQYPAYWSAARNSHAHGWAAGPTGVLMGEVLGVELTGPGGREWVVRPVLTRWLGWARGGFATGLGKWEVSLSRVVEEDEGERRGKKGVLVVVSTPDSTNGTVRLGEGGYEVAVEGGETRVWVLGEDDATVYELPTLESATTGDDGVDAELAALTMRESPFTEGWGLIFDNEFVMPEMEEWPVGVVDWDALEKNYAVPLWDMEW
ncbi:Alpha-l-rhamnosidase a [Pleurostoma richardsiae]|uniref:Alpha-l-rhamnosidase a n=1 Tax=Pleurostoma richardsiae TaxID=41990 RepID=A0AA38RNR7_9PEZI|nr:Alpha-l-rhamnosidase a [Pleurostoma richardsiae]